MAEIKIDAKCLQCPGPIVQLFNAARNAKSGDIIVVEATDRGFYKDVQAWCRKTGNELISLEDGDVIVARVKKA
ncbi:sulfurtransferase TusA family protein [Thermoanaerobacterium sp. DL9XJH110]|uniref:sulfurtransferase TusA family protein n=1 Tax=Thermoanaerobacterium sp. DL9XJH110 TaxID=3386643 RepID=UPI003BB5FC4A